MSVPRACGFLASVWRVPRNLAGVMLILGRISRQRKARARCGSGLKRGCGNLAGFLAGHVFGQTDAEGFEEVHVVVGEGTIDGLACREPQRLGRLGI